MTPRRLSVRRVGLAAACTVSVAACALGPGCVGVASGADAQAQVGPDLAVVVGSYSTSVSGPASTSADITVTWAVRNVGTTTEITHVEAAAITDGSAIVADGACTAQLGGRIFACGPQLSLAPGEIATVVMHGTGAVGRFAFSAHVQVTGDVDTSNNDVTLDVRPQAPPPPPPAPAPPAPVCDASYQRMIVQSGAFAFRVEGVSGRPAQLVGSASWTLDADGTIRGTAVPGQGTVLVQFSDGKCPSVITLQYTAAVPAPVTPAQPTLDSCGLGRPAVAFGTATEPARASLTRPTASSVADVLRQRVTGPISTDAVATELQPVKLTMRLTHLRRTVDGVLLLRVRDGSGTTQVVFPSVACLQRAGSVLAKATLRAREALTRTCGIPSRRGGGSTVLGNATIVAFPYHELDLSDGTWAPTPLLVPVLAFQGSCTRRAS